MIEALTMHPSPTSFSPARAHLILILSLALVLAAPSADASPMAGFQGHHSGSWWNPSRDGEGQFLSFEQVAGRRVAVMAWFTYDDQGAPRWLVGAADYAPGAIRVDIPLFSGRGGRFGAGFRSESVDIVETGTATLTLEGCNQIGLLHADAEGAFSLPLTRLHGPLEGTDCDGSRPDPELSRLPGSLSGAWWDAARAGEGSFIAFERAGERRIASVYYFSFDEAGAPVWRVGSTEVDPDSDRFEVQLLSGRGARFGTAFRATDVELVAAGRLRIEQDGCTATRMRYTGSVDFGLNWTRAVGALEGLPCAPLLPEPSELDRALRPLLAEHGLGGDPGAGRELPGIDAPLAQLGKLLFFSRALSAEGDVACASCHHPALGGADGLAVSVGTPAAEPDLVGPGRVPADGVLRIGRNANTFFNSALYERGLFWDSRVERLAMGGIATPDSAPGRADPLAGASLLAAQARFPVLAPAEMLGQGFPGLEGDAVRRHLAARIGNYGSGRGSLPPGEWLSRFQAAFDSEADAETLIRFETIAEAIAEYQRSAVFVETPWARYVRGNLSAIGDDAKAGALAFLRRIEDGGAQCAQCHRGDLFSDEQHHVLAFPQIGPGVESADGADTGRGRISGRDIERFAFRTPSLLNVALTAPYGHAGGYSSLSKVISHYRSPGGAVSNLMLNAGWCRLPPFDTEPGCADGETAARANSREALDQLQRVREQDPEGALPALPATVPFAVELQLAEFLRTLTDPCLLDRTCFSRWIPTPEEAPDAMQLNAVDADGLPL
ncbi:cytochrome-c peroxidase [Pseudomarimonas salicorniae]|uniref:Cytochrome c domain-containing protein n=1 Tax=Pseudomarimonas salicorniae TaxID=2933270 RepID=A0ABT0GI48_9GAMM|nr:cytochrome c peroxidase [Lysobacter sp. CAU 1642]MCK7594218.1 hypothetical protein [Lysobacter sp. CAU 1642]